MLKLKYFKKLIILLICVIITSFLIYLWRDGYTIATFKAGGDYSISIRTTWCWEISRPIYCVVTSKKETIIPEYFIGSTIEKIKTLNFRTVENKTNDVFAIVEMSSPYVVLAIFDFKNQRYWPFKTSAQDREGSYKQGKELVKQLNLGKYEIEYVLAVDMPGNINLKVSP